MIHHDTALAPRSGQTWPGPLPLISEDHSNLIRDLSQLCEMIMTAIAIIGKHIFAKQGLIYDRLKLSEEGNLDDSC